MEPEQSEQSRRFDAEAVARYINEERAETMRGLADLATADCQERAYKKATADYNALAAQITPEERRRALCELEGLRDSEGCID